jgi:hypothetical protein
LDPESRTLILEKLSLDRSLNPENKLPEIYGKPGGTRVDVWISLNIDSIRKLSYRKPLNVKADLRLFLVLAVAFSLATLAGPVSSNFHLPSIQPAHASSQPCETTGSTEACSEYWYPAGPAMNTLQATIFAGCTAEFTNLISVSPSIDLTDCAAPPSIASTCTSSPTLYITATVPAGQFCYLRCQPPGPCSTVNTWERAINDAEAGLPNYFTWLNIRNPSLTLLGTIRQALSQTTSSINPYVATTTTDQYIVRSVYDSLSAVNPLNQSQIISWMTENGQKITSVSYNGGVSEPPPGTSTTYRFTLRPDLTFQDGTPVTSYDAAFSYLSMIGYGASLASAAAGCFTGVTILGRSVFDLAVNSCTSPLTSLGTLPILPGAYWANAGGVSWASAVAACSNMSCPDVQYTLTGSTVNCAGTCTDFPASLMTVNPARATGSFDPIMSHALVGSGPWQCGLVTSLGSGVCSSTGAENPPLGGSYTLTAYTNYFRSSQRLAVYIWSGENDVNPIGPATAVGACFNVLLNLLGPCGHYQQGAGNPAVGIVGITAVSAVDIFFGLNWVAPSVYQNGVPPFEWVNVPSNILNPPTGIGPPIQIQPLNPVLYGLVPFDGSTTYTPNPGGNSCTVPNTYYDC